MLYTSSDYYSPYFKKFEVNIKSTCTLFVRHRVQVLITTDSYSNLLLRSGKAMEKNVWVH